MATKSETVADILREMREDDVRISARETPKTEKLALSYACDWCKGFADRIESAHRREVAELKKKCEEYERQPELMAETANAALELLKAQESKIAELQRRLKVAEEICNREIACRQKTAARCEMCMEDSSAGEDCPYHGEPNGCNSPTYGEYPSEKECEPFVAIIAEIRKQGGAKDDRG